MTKRNKAVLSLIVSFFISLIAFCTFFMISSYKTASGISANYFRYDENTATDYRMDKYYLTHLRSGQGQRVSGEVTGRWYYGYGDIRQDGTYSFTQFTKQDPSSVGGDTGRYTSGNSHQICWSYNATTRNYSSASTQTMYVYEADAPSTVKFTGLFAKSNTSIEALCDQWIPGINTGSDSGFQWKDGDVYVVSMWKIDAGGVFTKLAESTYSNSYAWLVPTSVQTQKMQKGEKVIFGLKCTKTNNEWYTNTLALFSSQATKTLSPAYVFNNDMVLQRDKQVNVYGYGGTSGRTVTVTFAGQTKTANPDSTGFWCAKLDPMSASSTGRTMTISDGTTTITYNNVLVGEVWYCGGQSNMEYTMWLLLKDRGYTDSQIQNMTVNQLKQTSLKEYADYTNWDKIRIYSQEYMRAYSPVEMGNQNKYLVNGWAKSTVNTPSSQLFGYSAYALGFALKLQKELNVPVGIVVSAIGGTSIEEWLSQATINKYNLHIHYDQATKAKCLLYNGMTSALNYVTVKGFLWYQGCADAGHNQESETISWVNDWKADLVAMYNQFKETHGETPFVVQSIVQCGDWVPWRFMHQAPFEIMNSNSNIYAVNGIDFGIPYDYDNNSLSTDPVNYIHPSDKKVLSENAAEVALSKVYSLSGYNANAEYPLSAFKSGSTVIIKYSSDVTLSLNKGTTVNNLEAYNGSSWLKVNNATVSGNEITIPNASSYTKIRYAQYNVMLETSTDYTKWPEPHFTQYNVRYNSEQRVNLYSTKGGLRALAVWPIVEMSITSAPKYTVIFNNPDGTQSSSASVDYGASITLPSYSPATGKVFVGWQIGDKLYPTGYSETVKDGKTYTAKVITFSTVSGARLRIADTLAQSGLRFEYSFGSAEYTALGSALKGYGALIVPTDLVGGKEINHSNFVSGSTMIDVVADSSKSQVIGGNVIYHAALTKLKEANYNRAFSTRGYIKVEYSNGALGYIYTAYTKSDNSRSASYIANYFIENETDTFNNLYPYQKTIIETYASAYTSPLMCDLTVNYVDVNNDTVAESYTEKIEYGDYYSVQSPVVKGYTPDKSSVNGTITAKTYVVNVVYSGNVYNVNYNYNGGQSTSSNPPSATFGVSFTPSVPEKSGYKFAGWAVSSDYDTSTARYGDSLSQDKAILSNSQYCYEINPEDADSNGNGYWNNSVSFKNLISDSNGTVNLKAMWTYVGKLKETEDSCGIINNAGKSAEDSASIKLTDGLTGDFELKFSFYQNALLDETDYSYINSKKTGVLFFAKHSDYSYNNHLYLNGLNVAGSKSAGQFTNDGTYNSSNDYGDMFYGLTGNLTGGSVKFGKFVKNSLVNVTITGEKVGYVNGKLTVSYTIKSFSKEYFGQSVSISYSFDLTDSVYYNDGIDIAIKAEDAEISIETASVTFLYDGYTFTALDSVRYGTLVDNYTHYCPDQYWTGDFDFTVSYHASQVGYFASISDASWRTPYIVFYKWQNTGQRILLREDCWEELGPSTTEFTCNNTLYEVGSFPSATTGKFTNNAQFSDAVKLQLYRNATVSCRCIRSGDTVTVYMFISYPGRTEITLVNGYKFKTNIEKLSFQIVGRTSGVTISYEEYSTRYKSLSSNALCGASALGAGSYTFGSSNSTRIHLALSFPVKAGTVLRYNGDTRYNWAVIESPAFYGSYDGNTHEMYSDTGWKNPSEKEYVVIRDCYIAFNLRYTNNTTEFDTGASALISVLKDLFSVSFEIDNINSRLREFNSSMLEENSTYGLTTYSGQFGEGNSRCHIAVIPLLKKGTVISFTGGTNYRWSVLELMNEREVLFDTTWMDPSTTTSYTVSRDCYVAVNIRYADNTTSFEGTNYKQLIYNSVKVEGYCGMNISENIETFSKTEEGDMQSVNHRGYSWEKPENTLSAYSTSKQKGFTKVETDVNFTSDGFGVLIHDGNINRTSNGGDKGINTITITEVRKYDFGYSAKFGESFKNELIPKFEEFIIACKNLQLHPYIELKDGTKAQIQRLATLVRRYGMEDNVTWISFSINCLTYIRDVSPEARLGFLNGDITESVVNYANSLKTGRNEVFLDINCGAVNSSETAMAKVALCKANDLPLELWTVDDEATMRNTYNYTNGYVTGYTSDNIIAENIGL